MGDRVSFIFIQRWITGRRNSLGNLNREQIALDLIWILDKHYSIGTLPKLSLNNANLKRLLHEGDGNGWN